MKQYTPIKKNINEKELNQKIETLADMITDALMEEARIRVVKRMNPNHRTPSAA